MEINEVLKLITKGAKSVIVASLNPACTVYAITEYTKQSSEQRGEYVSVHKALYKSETSGLPVGRLTAKIHDQVTRNRTMITSRHLNSIDLPK